MSHWAVKYIGIPWSKHFNCWEFFRTVQREQFGRDLPAIPLKDYRLSHKSKVIATHAERANWVEVSQADLSDGDGIIFFESCNDSHVGVWIEADGGRVLHSTDPMGGQTSHLSDLLNEYDNAKFYKYVGVKCHC